MIQEGGALAWRAGEVGAGVDVPCAEVVLHPGTLGIHARLGGVLLPGRTLAEAGGEGQQVAQCDARLGVERVLRVR